MRNARFLPLFLLLSGQAACGERIRVQSGVFVDSSCREFVFSGYNTWLALEYGADMIGDAGKAALQAQFAEAARVGLTVVRMFAFPVLKGFNLQLAPGVYNPRAWQGLDTAIALAGKNNLKLILAFTNNWSYNTLQTDWKCWYTNQSRTATGCNDFFTDPTAINVYKAHVRTVLTRNNSVTGIPYREDDTILGWNLMNEPRSEKPTGPQDIQAWIADVSVYVKTLTPNQLVTIGEDGFYQRSNCQSNSVNPIPNDSGGAGGAWTLSTGQDFLPNHLPPAIDFATIHLWADDWSRTDLEFGKKWLTAHINNTALLGKPLILEEFGKGIAPAKPGTAEQTPQAQFDWYKLAYSFADKSLDTGSGIKGLLFWRWGGLELKAPGVDEESTIYRNSTIFTNIIKPFSERVRSFMANPSNRPLVAGCAPLVSASSVPPPSSRGGDTVTTSSITPPAAGRKLLQADGRGGRVATSASQGPPQGDTGGAADPRSPSGPTFVLTPGADPHVLGSVAPGGSPALAPSAGAPSPALVALLSAQAPAPNLPALSLLPPSPATAETVASTDPQQPLLNAGPAVAVVNTVTQASAPALLAPGPVGPVVPKGDLAPPTALVLPSAPAGSPLGAVAAPLPAALAPATTSLAGPNIQAVAPSATAIVASVQPPNGTFVTTSTFLTPQGVTVANINSLQQCDSNGNKK